MATPKQNYARQFQAYAQGIEPDIPSSVRTYSIFNPDTGTWQRMTNNFRSPIPAQGQVAIPVQVPAQPAVDPVVQALALARQTQGRDWAMPLPQAPAQMLSGGSRRRSPASGGGTMVVPVDQAQSVPQTASKRGFDIAPFVYEGKPAKDVKISITPNQPAQAETVVQLPLSDTPSAPSSLYMGTGKLQDGTVVYDPSFNDYTPTAVLSMSPDSRKYDRVVDYDNDDEVLRVADVPLDTTFSNKPKPPLELSDAILQPLPKNFLRKKEKGPSFYYDPSESGTVNYNEEMKNLGRAISNDPETAALVGPVWGNAMANAIPVGAVAGGIVRGLATGANMLKNARIVKNLGSSYRMGKQAFKNSNFAQGTKKFFTYDKAANALAEARAENLARYQKYLEDTASMGQPLARTKIPSKVTTLTPEQAQNLAEFRDYLTRPSDLSKVILKRDIPSGYTNYGFTNWTRTSGF